MGFLRKISLLLFFSLFCSVGTAQEPDQKDFVLLHDSILTDNYGDFHLAELKGWKFSPKDDPSFSKKAYDDSDWFKVPGPLSEDDAIPDSLWNNFGWFRKKVKIHSSFPQEIVLENYAGADGAVELYINDSLIYKKGDPSPLREDQVLEANKLYHLGYYEFNPGETYQLAVKYSFHGYSTSRMFVNLRPPTDFGVHIFPRENLRVFSKRRNTESQLLSGILSILFMVMVLHLYLHRRSSNSANFWVFLITGFVFLFLLLLLLEKNLEFNNYTFKIALMYSASLAMSLVLGFLPLVIHKVLNVKPAKKWKYFTVAPLLFLILSNIFNGFKRIPLLVDISIGILLVILIFTGGIVAIVKAKRKRTQDLYLISGTFLGFPFFMLLGLILFNLLKVSDFLPSVLIFASFLLVIPVGMSLYQGKTFLRLHNQLDGMVAERTTELQQALENLQQSNENLKAAQDQLVQQEKLASLGQLTAGIAHEIKNPLNFVTNFSEVCLELLAEAKVELRAMATEAGDVSLGTAGDPFLNNVHELLETVEVNLQKIYQHGNRADGIVKSMLLHSRGGSGEFQPVSLNDLVQEYVNLAYHGMRAGKNPLDVKINFLLDKEVGTVSLKKEDFSRVILNLCNNAFDAMREKNKSSSYSPTLEVRTSRNDDLVELTVADNGSGIPEELLGKILQPFFTTKKGTDGTGLGLSITHDIIKAHGGTLNISSQFGEGSTFTVLLSSKDTRN